VGATERSRTDRFRAAIDRWNEGGIEAVAGTWHGDAVWEEPAGFPDAGTRRGREAIFSRMRDRFQFIGLVELEIAEVEEIGDRLYADVIVRGRGPTSGAPAEMHSFWVYDYADDGSVILWREFLARDEALAAARAD
jgi:ketosteroid isomerase-like protein